MKRRVTITEEDIAFGQPGRSWACAFVRAISRMFPGMKPQVCTVILPDGTMAHEARLHEEVGTINPVYEIKHIFRLSKNASAWISIYDATGKGEPGTFEMTEVELSAAAS